MPNKIVFLSHIHEEKELALELKDAIEREFSGFVDVFVSSDGTSIPKGTNFLDRIQSALIDCIGAIYLISPSSVIRNWINFELGAVWTRNVLSKLSGGPDILTIPICHSGISPSELPTPLNNLNAIEANRPDDLNSAFTSIQYCVGGKGPLRTDFGALAGQISKIEGKYTIGVKLSKILEMVSGPSDIRNLIDHCKKMPAEDTMIINIGFVEQGKIDKIQEIVKTNLAQIVSISLTKPQTVFGSQGAKNGAEMEMRVGADTILGFEKELLKLI